MDKYEYKLKLDQLKSLVSKEDYETAAEIANSINWKKVRNSNTLCMVGDIYEKVGKYEESKAVLLQAYAHSSIGRNIVAKLAEVALKAKDLENAESYYNEFVEIAPKDSLRYVIGYKLSCLKDAPISDRIAILEEFKEKEYSEMWAYELAALYSSADMRDKCVAACDELILWFGDGEYVEKALDLKRRYQPLTPSQEEKYQRFRELRGMVEISIPSKTPEVVTEDGKPIPEIVVTASKFNTVNLQEELARSMQQIMDATESGEVAESMDNIKKIVTDIPYLQVNEDVREAQQKRMNEQVDATLKQALTERMTAELPKIPVASGSDDEQIEGQMNIEDVLSEWERMKVAAEEAMKTAEEKKLEIAKENALAEATEIMNRLKALIPIISAQEEELPEDTDTIAENLKKDIVPKVIKAEPIEDTEDEEDASAASDGAPEALEPDLIAEIQAGMSKEIAEMTDVPDELAEEAVPEKVQATAAVQLPMEEEDLLTAGLAQEVSAVMNETKNEKETEGDMNDAADAEEALFTAGLADSIGALMQEVKAAKAKSGLSSAADAEPEMEADEETLPSADEADEEVIEAAPEVEEDAEDTADADMEAALEAALAAEIAAFEEDDEDIVEEEPKEEALSTEEVEDSAEEEVSKEADAEMDIEAALEAMLAQEMAAAMEEDIPEAEEKPEENTLESELAAALGEDKADTEADAASLADDLSLGEEEEPEPEEDIEAALEAALAQEMASFTADDEITVEEPEEEPVEDVEEAPAEMVEEPEADAEMDTEAALEAALAAEIAALEAETADTEEEPKEEVLSVEEPAEEAPAEMEEEPETDAEIDTEAALEAALAAEIAAMDAEAAEEASAEEEPADTIEEASTEEEPADTTEEVSVEEEPAEPAESEDDKEAAAEAERHAARRAARMSKFTMPDSLDDDLEEEADRPTLTEEQRQMFSYFLAVQGMETAIAKVIQQAPENESEKAKTSCTGNILITSPTAGYGKTVLATNLIRVLQKVTLKETRRIGKISADSLNKRDFNALVQKMDGGFLIIEKAGNLTREKAISMSLALGHDTRGMLVVLEDTKEAIEKLMGYDIGLSQKFTSRIDIPEFTIDELINFAKVYAKEMECEIDEMAVLALYNRLNLINRIDHVVSVVEVKDIMDRAIENAESGGFKKIFSKKYTEEDLLVLQEEDFQF